MNVNLSPIFEVYIRKQLEEGKYNNASEVVREALRMKMQQDEIYNTKLDALRSAIIVGEQSGELSAYNMEDIINEAKQEASL